MRQFLQKNVLLFSKRRAANRDSNEDDAGHDMESNFNSSCLRTASFTNT